MFMYDMLSVRMTLAFRDLCFTPVTNEHNRWMQTVWHFAMIHSLSVSDRTFRK